MSWEVGEADVAGEGDCMDDGRKKRRGEHLHFHVVLISMLDKENQILYWKKLIFKTFYLSRSDNEAKNVEPDQFMHG